MRASRTHGSFLAHVTAGVALVAGASLVTASIDPTAAYAQSGDTQAKAEEYYNKGDAAYNLGRFEEAIEWFTKAYEAWPLAEFLYNIAQSYRQLGNCKQALFFYKRFKSLKEKDKDSPLTKKQADEVNAFIKDLEECAKKADAVGEKDPNDTMGSGKKPTGGTGGTTGGTGGTTGGTGGTTGGTGGTTGGTGGTGGTTGGTGGTGGTTGGTGGTGGMTGGDDVAVVDDDVGDDDVDDDYDVSDSTTTQAKLISARAAFGATMIGAGDLEVPIQPAFLLTAGYPLPAGPVNLDVGLGFGFAPVPYRTSSNMSESAALTQIMLDAAATYPINDKIGLRGDLGLGLMSLGGLVAGSPFTEGGAATSGALSMFHFRVAVAADYAITPNIVASLTPFSFGYSPAKTGLVMDTLTRIDFLLGVGYRM